MKKSFKRNLRSEKTAAVCFPVLFEKTKDKYFPYEPLGEIRSISKYKIKNKTRYKLIVKINERFIKRYIKKRNQSFYGFCMIDCSYKNFLILRDKINDIRICIKEFKVLEI